MDREGLGKKITKIRRGIEVKREKYQMIYAKRLLRKFTNISVLPDGSSIRSSTRISLNYREKGKTIDILFDYNPETNAREVHFDSIKNWDNHTESISQEKREEIINKIIQYGKEHGYKVVIRRG